MSVVHDTAITSGNTTRKHCPAHSVILEPYGVLRDTHLVGQKTMQGIPLSSGTIRPYSVIAGRQLFSVHHGATLLLVRYGHRAVNTPVRRPGGT